MVENMKLAIFFLKLIAMQVKKQSLVRLFKINLCFLCQTKATKVATNNAMTKSLEERTLNGTLHNPQSQP